MATKERLIIETLFMIADKQQRDVPFHLNPIQATLDAALTGRDIIPKARQEGVSSYFLGRYLAKCLHERNTRAVVISHEREATQRLLNRVHYMIHNIRGPAPVVQHLSKSEITFPKTNSMFYIGTAGSRKFGRGDTITALHCSEIAYWADPDQLMSGLLQAVTESGEIALESTGNGYQDYYHKFCLRAQSGESRYRLHFFNWQDFQEYTVNLDKDEEEFVLQSLREDLEEPDLVKLYELTAGQIIWRRRKLEELGYDLSKFKKEYPMTLDECFQASGRSLFQIYKLVPEPLWIKDGANLWRLSFHPQPGRCYLLGADVGAGIGQDNSVIEIFDLETLEQVGEYASNRVDPVDFAYKIAELGLIYNTAFVTVENNNHGIVTLNELQGHYPIGRLYARPLPVDEEVPSLLNLGFRTTMVTKPFALGKLRALLATQIILHSDSLASELSTFIETDTGRMEAEDGCRDDRVMAAAMAVVGVERAALMLSHEAPYTTPPERDPFCLDYIIKELADRGKDFPITSQVADENSIPIISL